MDTEFSERYICVQILNNFDKEGVLDYSYTYELDAYESGTVRDYVLNILRRRSYIDFIVDHYSTIAADDMKPGFRNILRLAIYEIGFVGLSSDTEAIDEILEIAKIMLGSNTADILNAIIRNIQRESKTLPKPSFEDRNKLVATTFSHPEWLVQRWRERFGEREAFQLMQANNGALPYYVRVNTLRTTTQNFELRMKKMGIQFEASDWLPNFYKVDSVEAFFEKDLINKGVCHIHNIAAGFSPYVIDPQPGEIIYDLCARKGIKSIMLADLTNAESSILAVDESEHKLERIAEQALHFKAENIKIRRGKVQDLALPLADAVLLEAPSSASGVLCNHPEIRWTLTEEDFNNTVELQELLLEEAANMVKLGGRLVYTTRSLEPEENMEQVKKLMDKMDDNFELEKLDDFVPEEILAEDGFAFQTYPHLHNCDGYFGVLLKRVK